MNTKDLTVILDHFVICSPVWMSNISRKAAETARWQTRTAAVSLSDGWAWYCCNPVKAFWRITMSNSKPCNMHYNNKGILQTFFNLARAEQATDTTPVRFHALLLCYYFLSIHTPSIRCSFLTICPSLSMLHHLMSMHPSITLSLSFSISSLHSLFSSLASICLLTPPSCLSVSAGITFFASYLMSRWCNYRRRHFRNQIGFLGHFTAIFVTAADSHDLHVSAWKKNKTILQVAVRRWFRVDVLTFVERRREREKPRRKQQKTSAP